MSVESRGCNRGSRGLGSCSGSSAGSLGSFCGGRLMIGGSLAGGRRTGSSIGSLPPGPRDDSPNRHRPISVSRVGYIPALTFPAHEFFLIVGPTTPRKHRTRFVKANHGENSCCNDPKEFARHRKANGAEIKRGGVTGSKSVHFPSRHLPSAISRSSAP